MTFVNITIDNQVVACHEGSTILEAAATAGIVIPTLCHREGLNPSGNCRICVVEVAGAGTLVGACHTPVIEGMQVVTDSNRVREARRATIELLLAGHSGSCLTDIHVKECELHRLAADLEAGVSGFKVRRPRSYAMEDRGPYVVRDMSKCILCRNCIRACRELAGQNLYSMAHRGFRSKVVVGVDEPLEAEACKDCGLCVTYCPTGALSLPEGRTPNAAPPPLLPPERARGEDNGRQDLLALLKAEQDRAGYVSRQAMAGIALNTGTTLSEVFGVASFYSFLYTRPKGRNVIRVCKSVPCYLKDAPMIIATVQETLGISPGQSTPDGRFAFELVHCIGA